MTDRCVPVRHSRDRAGLVGLACLAAGVILGAGIAVLSQASAGPPAGPCPHGDAVRMNLTVDGGTITCSRCGRPIGRDDLEDLRQRAEALAAFLRAAAEKTTTTTEMRP
jgi:hypothetical protein